MKSNPKSPDLYANLEQLEQKMFKMRAILNDIKDSVAKRRHKDRMEKDMKDFLIPID